MPKPDIWTLRKGDAYTRRGLFWAIEITKRIRDNPNIIGIDIVGSVARSEAKRGSDLDLLIQVDKDAQRDVLDSVTSAVRNLPIKIFVDYFVTDKQRYLHAKSNNPNQFDQFLASFKTNAVRLFRKK